MVTLSGCSKNAAHAAKQIPSASPTTDTTVSAQAYENGEELSADEQMQEENIRREEVAKQYSIYEPYGMTYDKKTDRFFYEGKWCVISKIQLAMNTLIHFSLMTVL